MCLFRGFHVMFSGVWWTRQSLAAWTTSSLTITDTSIHSEYQYSYVFSLIWFRDI